MRNWTDVYKLPLTRLKPYCQVFDQSNNHVLDSHEDMAESVCDKLLKIINGDLISDYTDFFEYEKGGQFIHIGNKEKIIDIRGWGYLTGTGGLNLSQEEAANIQDTFGEFITSKLNGDEKQ